VSRPLKTYTVCLNLVFKATDDDQAAQIARDCRQHLLPAVGFLWKLDDVEIDDLEEL
jgi:hypothetical protein